MCSAASRAAPYWLPESGITSSINRDVAIILVFNLHIPLHTVLPLSRLHRLFLTRDHLSLLQEERKLE